ncbi:MAG: DNA mismatch repair endonuclease MutL [Chloroflexi bacterium]|nr:DNA mismatch repair endonuclease MutL [Chloroflexota bacterium]
MTTTKAATGRVARIRVLPPEVAARIAAGEVIERPASVVKELVENALDAGAGRIEVAIEGGGAERIRVRDDGRGIAPGQLAAAFERHATSKLRAAEELFAVRTLGFRGEALAAIAAAANVTCTTRTAGESAAAVARFRDGRPLPQGSAAAAEGTTFEVRGLFGALPARRHFLRSARAEARAVTLVVADYALARPEVALRLESEGRTVLASPGAGGERAAWAAVYDDDLAASLVAFGHEAAGEHGTIAVRGLVGPPERHRGNRTALHLVVNGRAVSDRALAFAVERAYEGLLPSARHPVGLVRIEVDPAAVDVNVHPAKAEVRFREPRAVASAVTAAVRGALAGAAAPALGGPGLAPLAAPGASPEARAVLASARPASPLVGGSRWGPAPDATREGAALPPGERRPGERLPALRPLGQFDEAFLVAEAPDGLYLVDQHAAHERVRYEQVQARLAAGEVASQPLLEAELATLGAAHAALAAEEAEALAALGFVLEPTDGSALIVRAVPVSLAGWDPAAALRDLLDRMEADERLSGPERAAASLACRSSVRAGDQLAGEQQRELLRSLEACEHPQTCPHGRPTLLRLSSEQVRRSFGRR